MLGELVSAGLDVARLNLSHGTHGEHRAYYRAVRDAADAAGRGVGVVADLQGPKISAASRRAPSSWRPVSPSASPRAMFPAASTRYRRRRQGLPHDVRRGDRILIDDGRLALEVTAVDGPTVRTTVLIGGPVSDHKGLNLPGVDVSTPALTDKDAADLRFALELGADLVAMSFVRRPGDAGAARAIMNEIGTHRPLIAKIEKPEAVRSLPEIVDAFDGIMVARGDLGVELPLEQVPVVQKRAIEFASERAKPVIVATQMLESMVGAPRPTRAEASDVATAIAQGADAVMLSAETSVGAYPVDAVATMARIIAATEADCLRAEPSLARVPTTIGGAIARAAAEVGAVIGARALVAFTLTGQTVRRLARYRSPIPLLAFTPDRATRQQLALTWGVETFIAPPVRHTDDMVRQVDRALLETGRCAPGDAIVIVAGSPPGQPGRTNALRVHHVGDAPAERQG